MGSWGVENFANDAALNILDDVIAIPLREIEAFLGRSELASTTSTISRPA